MENGGEYSRATAAGPDEIKTICRVDLAFLWGGRTRGNQPHIPCEPVHDFGEHLELDVDARATTVYPISTGNVIRNGVFML